MNYQQMQVVTEFRQLLGTQTEVGELMGATFQTISTIERNVADETFIPTRWAQYFDAVCYLYREKNPLEAMSEWCRQQAVRRAPAILDELGAAYSTLSYAADDIGRQKVYDIILGHFSGADIVEALRVQLMMETPLTLLGRDISRLGSGYETKRWQYTFLSYFFSTAFVGYRHYPKDPGKRKGLRRLKKMLLTVR